MKFIDIIKNLKWAEVKQSLLGIFPDTTKSIVGYESVFNTLLVITPIKSIDKKDRRIVLEKVYQKWDDPDLEDEYYIDVCGKDGSTINDNLPNGMDKKDDKIGLLEQKFALELTSWEEWLNMEIDKQTLLNYSKAEIAAHCIWEMTFYGFDQNKIKAQKDEIGRRVKELDNMTEEEKRGKINSYGRGI